MDAISVKALEMVAREYDARLGPTLLAPWISHTIDAAHVKPGDQVLDVACGPGELTLQTARRTGAAGHVTGLDLNPGMLALARTKSSHITWLEGDAETLPFADNQFDAVICQFGLMLFPDPAKALREMYRVVAHHRHLVVAVFGDLAEQPVYRALAEIYDDVVSDTVGNLLRVPFSMGSADRLNRVFSSAGIHDTEHVRLEEAAIFASLKELALADIEGWFPFAGVTLTPAQVEAVIAEVQSGLAPFQRADGTIHFPVSVHLVTATKRTASEAHRPLAI